MDFLSDAFFEETINESTEIKSLLTQSEVFMYLEDGEQSKGFLQNAIDKILNLIKSLLNTISNAVNRLADKIRYTCLSKESKQKYDAFVEFAKKNPQVRKKTVTVKDWKRIEREYDKCRKNILSMMNNDTVDANGLSLQAHDMINNLASIAKSSTAALTVDYALNLAKNSPETAKMIQNTLLQDQSVLNNIQQELGKKEVQRLQKKVNNLSKETVCRKILIELGLKKEKDMTDCMSEYVNSLSSLVGSAINIGKSDTNSDKLKNGKKLIKNASNHSELVRGAAKSYTKNQNVRRGVKQVAGAANELKGKADYIKQHGEAFGRDPVGYAVNTAINKLF